MLQERAGARCKDYQTLQPTGGLANAHSSRAFGKLVGSLTEATVITATGWCGLKASILNPNFRIRQNRQPRRLGNPEHLPSAKNIAHVDAFP
jgi:hypothetical protein